MEAPGIAGGISGAAGVLRSRWLTTQATYRLAPGSARGVPRVTSHISPVASVDSSLEPHRLTDYVRDLAMAFTAFYTACPVVSAEPAVRASRLVIVEATARVLLRALDLLGIAVPERM